MKPRLVLNADDSRDDAYLFLRACRRAGVAFDTRIVDDGRAAIDYLKGSGEYTDRERHPMPDLMLIDLKMPLVSGFEVLKWMKETGELSRRPAIIFSSSLHDRDVHESYLLGAAAYLVKPVDYGILLEVVRQIDAALRKDPMDLELLRSLPDYRPPPDPARPD